MSETYSYIGFAGFRATKKRELPKGLLAINSFSNRHIFSSAELMANGGRSMSDRILVRGHILKRRRWSMRTTNIGGDKIKGQYVEASSLIPDEASSFEISRFEKRINIPTLMS